MLCNHQLTGVDTTREKWAVAEEVLRERNRQDIRWGEQNHPDGTGVDYDLHRDMARRLCDENHAAGDGTWLHILLEEVYEAAAEDDQVKLRAELVQVAAVAQAWAEAIDRRADQ